MPARGVQCQNVMYANVRLRLSDYNGADEYFATSGSAQWAELREVLEKMPLFLHASDQRSKIGTPIFDPKGTNAHLTREAQQRGWSDILVPTELRMFGLAWDGGKGATLTEWQFSNYPFLWNNIIRSEAVYRSSAVLPGMSQPTGGLIQVTKDGDLPASNSTLYFEQAKAQIEAVIPLNIFRVPIRLVGIGIEDDADGTDAMWTVYPGRYGRLGVTQERRFMVNRGPRPSQYGLYPIAFTPD